MTKSNSENGKPSNDVNNDAGDAGYVLPPRNPPEGIWKSHDRGDKPLGELRQPDVFETEQ